MVCAGYYDIVTPYFSVQYTFNHLGLHPEMLKNVELAILRSGPHDVHRPRFAPQAEARYYGLY